jgi:hypothetical protein
MNREKIQRGHPERTVMGPSSRHQVHHRLESRPQYDLAGPTPQLGFAAVIVVDEDQGRSGRGFSGWFYRVAQGQVGTVFALEASRLGRINHDWHRSLDLCAVAGTLAINHDSVYDPRLLNDRLRPGFKGRMSEFEWGLYRPHHPQAGCEVGVLARRRSSGTLPVLLPDDMTAALSEGMSDAAYCKALLWPATPVLSLSAWRDLRWLVDAVCFPCDPNISTKKAHDETTQPSDRAAVGQRDGAGGVAGGSNRPVPSTDRSNAAGSPAGRKGGRR